jgi:hypothetical protein
MKARKRAGSDEIATTVVVNPEAMKPTLKRVGGSQSDDWNNVLANQAVNTLWLHPSEEFQARQRNATLAALVGIRPKDEIEAMIAAQLLAAHSAAMECYRRATLSEQTFEGRSETLSQANKLCRTYAQLLEALNRHRGKGQRKVTVEHVHVHAGGQAVVGMVETSGGGEHKKSKDQPHAKQIADAPQPPMWSSNKEGNPVPVAGDGEWALPNARRQITRRPER